MKTVLMTDRLTHILRAQEIWSLNTETVKSYTTFATASIFNSSVPWRRRVDCPYS